MKGHYVVRRRQRYFETVWMAAWLLPVCGTPSYAVDASAVLSGTVTHDGVAVSRVEVTASGNDLTVKTTSDAGGRFSFPPLMPGTYDLEAHRGNLRGRLRVDLDGGGATVSIALEQLAKIAHTIVGRSQSLITRGSGSDVLLNSTDLARLPFDSSFTQMETQMPGAAQGANGVVHINGDHGVIGYLIDGVALPQELNRDIGSELNLNDLSFIGLVEGAYPAQYGLKFGSIFNMSSRAGAGTPGFDGYGRFGSYTNGQGTIGYHAPLAGRGGFDVGLTGLTTTRGLDPPDFSSPHNDAGSVSQFGRVALPSGGNSFINVTFFNSHDRFQIPNDINFGEPGATDDIEDQADTFLAIQFSRALGNAGLLRFGPAYNMSTIQDFGDPHNDWLYGESLDRTAPPFGNGGSPTDCAGAFSVTAMNPTVFPTVCGLSLADRRTETDYMMEGNYTQSVGSHTLGTGVSYDLSRVLKFYSFTLQPENFLAPIFLPTTPGAPYATTDDAPNVGNTYQSYIEDSWRWGSLWQADYGLRYDFFSIKSAAFVRGFGAFSPRLKITRFFGNRAALYGYIGRFFEPFSFENVSPRTAYLLNLPLSRTEAQFDLKPERDTQLEIGGHIPAGRGELGFRVWQKNANDLIDDTQVGVSLLHQDINYVLGRLSQQALTYSQPLPLDGRAYFAVAHVISLNSGCETQLLAPCFGQPVGFTPADHEQRWTINGGLLLNNQRGGWLSADTYYGSGLSSASCPPGTPGYCKRTPHAILNLQDGIAISPRAALTLDVQNVLNDRYYVTLLNAQGNHYAAPREFNIGIRFRPTSAISN